MQPDSECNKRVRANKAGGGTPKDSTPTQKTGAFKKTSTLIGGTPTSSTNKKKTDISQFFKKLEKSTPNSFAQYGGGDGSNGGTMPESPATLLLNRIDSECYTPLELFKKTTKRKETNLNYDNHNCADNVNGQSQVQNASNSPRMKRYVKKALDFIQDDTTNNTIAETTDRNNDTIFNKEENVTTKRRRSNVITKEQSIIETESGLSVSPSSVKKNKPQRRHSLMPVSEIETATDFMKAMAISITPSRATRRRSSLHTAKDMTVENSNKLNNVIEPISEESNAQEIPSISENLLKSVGKRRTLYTVATMDQTDCIEMEAKKDIEDKSTNRKSTRRRTIYASKTMETSEMQIDNKINNGFNVTTRRRTCYSVKAIEQTTEITESPAPPRTPIRKTLTSGKEKHLNEVATTKKDKLSSRRRTLFTKATDKPNDTDTEFSQSNDIDKTVASSVNSNMGSITITNFNEDDHIASSTLVTDRPKETKSAATPVADDITGKLLEESSKCPEPVIFSSTRLPGNRRRTLFDVSMDIITQRLQCINQFARRSLAPPTPLSEVTNSTESVVNTGVHSTNSSSSSTTSYTSLTTSSSSTLVASKTNQDMETDTITIAATAKDSDANAATANLVTPKATDVKKKRKLFMPNELLSTPPLAFVPSHETTDDTADVVIVKEKETNSVETPVVVTSKANDVKKKRKLFMPNELLLTPPPPPAAAISTLISEPDHLTVPTNNALTKSCTKRRRTLMPISQPQPTIVTQKSAPNKFNSSKGVKNRRSTLDFEEIQNIKTKISKAYVDNAETSSSSGTDKEFFDAQQEVKPKKLPVLVYTNMHHQQIDVIHEVGTSTSPSTTAPTFIQKL